jgi:hypothetical protein
MYWLTDKQRCNGCIMVYQLKYDFEGNIDRLVMDWDTDEVYAPGLI